MRVSSLVTAVLAVVSISLPIGAAWAGPGPGGPFILIGPDINGDGNSDIVIEEPGGFIIGYQMDGLGLKGADAIPGTYGDFVTTFYADLNGDLNSDKIMELRSGDASEGYTVAFLLNDDFTFTTAEVVGSYGDFETMGFPDVNGDGRGDKVMENTNALSPSKGYSVVFLHNADLTFTTAEFAPSYNTFETAGFPDIDGDGNADKVVEDSATGYSVAFLSDGFGGYSLAGEIPGSYNDFTTLGFADVDGDGNADKIIGDSTGFILAYLLADDLTFRAIVLPGTYGENVETIGFPDLNGDGQADKVQINSVTGHTVGFIFGDATGADMAYTAGAMSPTAPGSQLLGYADFDGDKKSDKITQNTTTGVIAAFLNDGLTTVASGPVVTPPNTTYVANGWDKPWQP